MQLSLLDRFPFGKYKGELVGSVIEDDPSYIAWLLDKTDHTLTEAALTYYEKQEEA